MIVDTSAIYAIVNAEPGWQIFVEALHEADTVRMSAASLLELGLVVDGRHDPAMSRRLDSWLTQVGVDVVPFTLEQAGIARAAYRDYGRGSGHPARLNFGDCFAYALAAVTHEPLLFKGDDFSHTDVTAAV